MMKELLKKLQKKSNKKGFTLVEIIVVLVILAILAAIAVPSVLGYVNEAKEERYIQEAHSIYLKAHLFPPYLFHVESACYYHVP